MYNTKVFQSIQSNLDLEFKGFDNLVSFGFYSFISDFIG